MGDSLTNLTNLPRNGPRIMGTNLRPSLLPHGVTKERKGKVIFLIRNPKDTAVSLYHFHRMNRNLGLYEGTWAQFFQWFLNGEVVFGSWFDYVLDWIQFLQQNRDILCVKYEDMVQNLGKEVKRIAEYLGYSISLKEQEEIAARCTFASMSRNPAVNLEDAPFFDVTRSKFLRKGEVGDWKNYFTVRQNELFDKAYQMNMEGAELYLGLGYR